MREIQTVQRFFILSSKLNLKIKSFLGSLSCRSWVYGVGCSAPTTHKPVQQRKNHLVRTYCPSKYTVILVVVQLQIVRENLFQLFEVRSESWDYSWIPSRPCKIRCLDTRRKEARYIYKRYIRNQSRRKYFGQKMQATSFNLPQRSYKVHYG